MSDIDYNKIFDEIKSSLKNIRDSKHPSGLYSDGYASALEWVIKLKEEYDNSKQEHPSGYEEFDKRLKALHNNLVSMINDHQDSIEQLLIKSEGYRNDIELLQKEVKELNCRLQSWVQSIGSLSREMYELKNKDPIDKVYLDSTHAAITTLQKQVHGLEQWSERINLFKLETETRVHKLEEWIKGIDFHAIKSDIHDICTSKILNRVDDLEEWKDKICSSDKED